MPHWHIQVVRKGGEPSARFLGRLVVALRNEGMKITARTDERVLFRAEEARGRLAGVAEGEVLVFPVHGAEGGRPGSRLVYRLCLDRLVAGLYLTMTGFLAAGLVGGLLLTGDLAVEGAFWATPAALPLGLRYVTRRRKIRCAFDALLNDVVSVDR